MGFERLKDRINETGISQRAIADALDTFPSTISTKITNGGVWKLEDICTICAMLDIPPGEIFLSRNSGTDYHITIGVGGIGVAGDESE